jgi:hypothetical protein
MTESQRLYLNGLSETVPEAAGSVYEIQSSTVFEFLAIDSLDTQSDL